MNVKESNVMTLGIDFPVICMLSGFHSIRRSENKGCLVLFKSRTIAQRKQHTIAADVHVAEPYTFKRQLYIWFNLKRYFVAELFLYAGTQVHHQIGRAHV